MGPGSAPAVGSPAPAFTLRSQHGESLAPIGSGRAVLLVFFPFAFSSICSSELAGLQQHRADFEAAAVNVIAISCDPVYSLRAMADHDQLSLTLLSDFWPHGQVAGTYGCFDQTAGAPSRSSFLVDGRGVVRWTLRHGMAEPRTIDQHRSAIPRVS